MNPQKLSGYPGSFSSTNMGIIGFATNGVYKEPVFGHFLGCQGLIMSQIIGLKTGEKGQYHYHVGSECLATCNAACDM